MDFTNHQMRLTRSRLNTHFELDEDLSWEKIALDICVVWEEAGLPVKLDEDGIEEAVVGTEAIRRYCNGTTDSSSQTRQAIFTYMTDPEVRLMTEEEFENAGQGIDCSSARHLLGFLYDANSDEVKKKKPVPAGLRGEYIASEKSPDIKSETTVIVGNPDKYGMVQVSLEERHAYGHKHPEAEAKGKPDRVLWYDGYGILTPEDYLLVFLKPERNDSNKYYMAVASQADHGNKTPSPHLFFYEHSAPVTMMDQIFVQGEAMPNVGDYLAGAIRYYYRK